jgi:hypothetical protein
MASELQRGHKAIRWLPDDTFRELVVELQSSAWQFFCEKFSARHLEHLDRSSDTLKCRDISRKCFAEMKDIADVQLSRQLTLMDNYLLDHYKGPLITNYRWKFASQSNFKLRKRD